VRKESEEKMEVVHELNPLITSIEGNQDVVVIVLTATRDLNGQSASIVGAQKDAAMYAAKSVLQVLGIEVGALSSSLVVPAVELAEGETLALNVDVKLIRTDQQEA
jgi:prolyl-tRNA editing enzyme YbaK/EbsC (Cys-tRNA(Pro) deacylase)